MNELSFNLRNTLIGVLELISSEEGQRDGQRESPYVSMSNELFNLWGDVYHPRGASFQEGFSVSELRALARFDAILNEISDQTPKTLPPIDQFIATEHWRRLSTAAGEALQQLQPLKT